MQPERIEVSPAHPDRREDRRFGARGPVQVHRDRWFNGVYDKSTHSVDSQLDHCQPPSDMIGRMRRRSPMVRVKPRAKFILRACRNMVRAAGASG